MELLLLTLLVVLIGIIFQVSEMYFYECGWKKRHEWEIYEIGIVERDRKIKAREIRVVKNVGKRKSTDTEYEYTDEAWDYMNDFESISLDDL